MYGRFAASLVLSFFAMYAFMFSELAQPSHFHVSLGMVWMTLSMVAAMAIVMALTMGAMLPDRRVRAGLLVAFGLLLLLSFAASRAEWGMGEEAFLRSMIPHHSSAVHMCREATLTNPEVVELCRSITTSQSREIAQMEAILAR